LNNKFHRPIGGQVIGAEKQMIRQLYVGIFSGVLNQIAGSMTKPIVSDNGEVTMYTADAIAERADEIAVAAMRRLGYELKPNEEAN
jgi:hypothetical protein